MILIEQSRQQSFNCLREKLAFNLKLNSVFILVPTITASYSTTEPSKCSSRLDKSSIFEEQNKSQRVKYFSSIKSQPVTDTMFFGLETNHYISGSVRCSILAGVGAVVVELTFRIWVIMSLTIWNSCNSLEWPEWESSSQGWRPDCPYS